MSLKSDCLTPSKEAAAETHSQESILNQSKKVAVKILMLRYCLVFILVGLASGLGAGSFILLRYRELSTFRGEFISATTQTRRSLAEHLQKSLVAATLISNIYQTEILNSAGAALPFYTLPAFDKIVDGINQLSKSRITTFSPLITNSTRQKWEQYAQDNVDLLNGPPSLKVSKNGSWIVADGIYTTNSQGKPIRSPNSSVGSLYPNLMFPVWQVAPLAANSIAVMFDPHAKEGTRRTAIDKAIASMMGTCTDIVQFLVDKTSFRPSTILYFPMTATSSSDATIGLLAIAFTWDEILTNILPSYLKNIDVVISTSTSTVTLSLENGAATVVGPGDLHNRDFDQYMTVISNSLSTNHNILVGYTIALYPTESFYRNYITTYPQNVCIGAVTIIVFTALVFTLYVYLVNMRQASLEELATRSLVRDTTRDAVLQSKKIYVRYISHEMRTPLNVAFLGLKILSKDLSRDPANSDRVETVSDISKACNMALGILNDLLNFDKLEDGTLFIEPKKVVALPFILKSTEVLNLQAKEKGLVLNFDVDNTKQGQASLSQRNLDGMSGKSRGGDPVMLCLSNSDFINVDPYKMNQVIGNLISNAIKFSPIGRSVTIRARKVLPSLQHPLSECQEICGASSDINTKPKRFCHIWDAIFHRTAGGEGIDLEIGRHYVNTDTHSTSDSLSPCMSSRSGYLLVEVTDTGVGMDPADSKRLFKEIVQFNPSKLQAGGGSGLGMMIAKGIVDLHGGEISVYSAGEGLGSTFTLKIPLMETPALSREESDVGDETRFNSRRSSATPGDINFAKLPLDETSSSSSLHYRGMGSEEKRGQHEQIALLMESEDPASFVEMNCAFDDTHLSAFCPPSHSRSHSQGDFPTSATLPPSPAELESDDDDSNHPCFEILIVDDSKLNRKMLVKSLLAGHHHCDEAEDGLEAVSMVKKRWNMLETEGIPMYDAILMDFMMPNMDGPTATREIRTLGFKGVVIGVTGNALPSDMQHFMIHGADKVLLKPVDIDTLQSALLKLLSN